MPLTRFSTLVAVACVAVGTLGLAACGKDKKKSKAATATPLAVTITESGKTAAYNVPATVKGGLVTLTVQNQGKAPHSAQLIVIGGHTAQEVFKVFADQSGKTPAWLRGEGGTSAVPPGGTASATVNLPPGKYMIVDPPQGGPSSGPPGYKEFTVTQGTDGSLPSTPVTLTAANPGKDKYKWEINGTLKAGANNVTFVSKGKSAIHFIGAFRVTGNPSKAEIIKGLASNGPPPKFVDQASFSNTAVLDGGKSQTLSLTLNKPGEYVLFCPLTDRDGGKTHDKEGLLTTVQVG